MKALSCTAFGSIDRLRIEDLAILEPAAGQVRIRAKAASLDFPDALIVQGLYQVKPAQPFSPAAEFAGVIDAVGDGGSAWRPGDGWSRSPATAASPGSAWPTCTRSRRRRRG